MRCGSVSHQREKSRLYRQNSCSIIWSPISSRISPLFFLFSPLLTLNKDPAAAAEVALFSPLPFISASVSHHLQLDRVGHKGRHTLTQGGIIRGVSDDRKSSGFTSIQRVGFFFTHTVNVSQWKQSSLYVSLWLSVWISIWAQRFFFFVLSLCVPLPCWYNCLSVHFHKKKKEKTHERWWRWRLISHRVSITLRKWRWRWKFPPLVSCLELLWCEIMDVSQQQRPHTHTRARTHINTHMFSSYINSVRERDEWGNINRTDRVYRVGGNEFALPWAACCWWHTVIRGIIPFPFGVSLLFACVDSGVSLMQRDLEKSEPIDQLSTRADLLFVKSNFEERGRIDLHFGRRLPFFVEIEPIDKNILASSGTRLSHFNLF